ncbi:MAG: hypothetical protein IKO44_01030 [Ruminococcus sp.]|nr:hypothetical protein [Ruminococcus sp.]
MEMINKKAAVIGIAGAALYFVSVSLFIATQNDILLTLWELMTVFGAVLELVVLLHIADRNGLEGSYLTLLKIFLSGTLILTSAAHFTSIGVIRPLAADGKCIPDWLKIGNFPSLEMTVDYTAWGFFMGAALLVLALGTKNKGLRNISAVSAVLCFAGFVGSFFNENLWYPAPIGYGFGFPVMCILLLKQNKKTKVVDK